MNTAYNQYSKYLKHLLEVECAEKELDFNKIFISYLKVAVPKGGDPDAENKIWSKCETKEDYEGYLNKYPNGKFANEAKKRIEQIIKLIKEEQDFWNQCKTVKDYENYLKKYPTGKYTEDVRNKIEQIIKKEEDFWNKCESIEDYKDYLSKYPKGRFSTEAKEKINELGKTPLPPEKPGDLQFDDGYYIGETKDGLMHGHGTRFWNENDKKWEGDWENGEASGHVVVTFGDFVVYDGQMEHGLPNGQGVYTDINNGQRYEGSFVDFKREGEGVLYTEIGDKIYDGEWKNNKYHGYGQYFLRGQCRYEGNWENGKRNGDGIAYDQNGQEEYNGSWKDDVRLNDIDRIKVASQG